LAITFPAHLDIHAPFDGFFHLFECIYSDAVSPASHSDEDSTVLHDDDALEADTTNESIRMWSWRGDDR